jgi:hypothetical protein
MPMDMDKMMRDMMARMPKELSEASDVTDEGVALVVASMLANRTLGLIKSPSNEGGMSENIETFTLVFTLVQRLTPAPFAEMYVQTCNLLGQSQLGRKADFKQ